MWDVLFTDAVAWKGEVRDVDMGGPRGAKAPPLLEDVFCIEILRKSGGIRQKGAKLDNPPPPLRGPHHSRRGGGGMDRG